MVLFIIIWATWFVAELLLRIFKTSGEVKGNMQDKNTLRLMWFSIGGSISVAVYMQISVDVPISGNAIVPLLGLVIMLIGMIIRSVAIISLGKFFTVDVTIKKDHTLKTDGLYSVIRHPSYTGLLLTSYGLGISFNNWISLGIIAFFITTSVIKRIYTEENALLQNFGEEYLEYQKKTKRLLPFIF